MIRDTYTTIATHNYPHHTLLNITMLATAEVAVLYIVLSLGRNLQISTSILFADTLLTGDTVLSTNFYGMPHCILVGLDLHWIV